MPPDLNVSASCCPGHAEPSGHHGPAVDLCRAMRLAGFGCWTMDAETRAIAWSEQVYRIHGLEPGTPVDLSLALSFYDGEERGRLGRAVTTALATGGSFEDDFAITARDGSRRWLRLAAEVDGCPHGRRRLVGIAADVTEKHADRLPMHIQFHGNPVRFRNIWVRDLVDLEWKKKE